MTAVRNGEYNHGNDEDHSYCSQDTSHQLCGAKTNSNCLLDN